MLNEINQYINDYKQRIYVCCVCVRSSSSPKLLASPMSVNITPTLDLKTLEISLVPPASNGASTWAPSSSHCMS